MSTEFFNDQWRIPSNENQNKISNYSMEFNGSSDFINCGDSDNLSFGNGSTDSPFSISAWVNMTDATNFVTIAKDSNSGREYVIRTLSADRLHFYLLDNSSSGYIGRKTPAVTSNQNTWIHTVYTYNGNRSSSGIKIYLNGSPVDNDNYQGGSYTAMENTNAALNIGRQERSTSTYANGKIDQVNIFDYELSQDQVIKLGADGYAFASGGSLSGFIDLANPVPLGTNKTVSFWFKLSSSAAFSFSPFTSIVNSGNCYYPFFLNSSSTYSWYLSASSCGGGPYSNFVGGVVERNKWVHAAVVGDGSNVKCYINGLEEINIANKDRNPTIQRLFYYNTLSQVVEFSNFSIFNTNLSATGTESIASLYNNGNPPDLTNYSNISHWWKLNAQDTFDGSNWTITDYIGGNTGTSNGMDASNLVVSNIDGELIANPMATSPKPIAYYQLGDQSVSTGPSADYLVPNNSLQDYVFDFPTRGVVHNVGVSNKANVFDNATNFSFSGWFKIEDLQNSNIFEIKEGNNYRFNINYYSSTSNGQIRFNVNSSGSGSYSYGVGANSFVTDWFHYAGVYDGNGASDTDKFKLYINGSPVILTFSGTLPTNMGSLSGNNTINLGNTISSSFESFDGKASSIQMWNTSLLQSEVETLYNNGTPYTSTPPQSSNLQFWYKLNAQDTFDGTNWTIKDYGLVGADLTSSGMTSANLVQSNLQYTSGYSPYALDFDGTNDLINCGNDSSLQITGAMTVSYWFKGQGGSANVGGFGKLGSSRGFCLGVVSSGSITFYIAPTAATLFAVGYSRVADTNWHHLVGVYNPSTSAKIYLDGNLVSEKLSSVPANQYNGSNNLQIGARGDNNGAFNGEISNAAIWNTNLSATEITEIYNQGVPSNLNTFSGTAPVSWWQIGSNSSFNTNWTCLDEIGTNNGESVNMTEDDITNGVGYSANGLGTSSIEIVGDAPYSTANGLSENMDVLDRTTDVPG